MHSWMVWTAVHVDEGDLRTLAADHEGHWNEIIGDEAIIERGEARVFISVENVRDEMVVYGADQATEALGQPPQAVVFIAIGHAAGSVELAREIGAEAIARWGGILDENRPASSG